MRSKDTDDDGDDDDNVRMCLVVLYIVCRIDE